MAKIPNMQSVILEQDELIIVGIPKVEVNLEHLHSKTL
jgi:hypothetical protein